MGIPVLIMGESGSGKSASLRNFEPEDVGIFNAVSYTHLDVYKRQLVRRDRNFLWCREEKAL